LTVILCRWMVSEMVCVQSFCLAFTTNPLLHRMHDTIWVGTTSDTSSWMSLSTIVAAASCLMTTGALVVLLDACRSQSLSPSLATNDAGAWIQDGRYGLLCELQAALACCSFEITFLGIAFLWFAG
jgi:hypothetical protein